MPTKPLDLPCKIVSGKEPPWIIWCIWGLIALAIYLCLYLLEDALRVRNVTAAEFVAICKVLLVCFCATGAWRRSRDVDAGAWTVAARALLILCVGLTAITL